MRCTTLLLSSALAFAGVAAAAESAGKVLFTDTFQSAQLAPEWQVIEGKWGIEDGSLACRDGGTIALNVPPGGRFALEFEIAFPSNWMSVIPFFTGPEDYGTLYLGGGYWETFEVAGKELANYVQRKDPEIVRTGGFQKVRMVSEYGVISFTYDGKAKGPGVLPYRPGARIAFRSLPKSGLLRLRDFRLEQLSAEDRKTVATLPAADLAEGMVHEDRGMQGKLGDARRWTVDAAAGVATLTYQFSPGAEFESCFVRLPADAARSRLVVLEVEGDGQGNNVFVIVHDASGEQHLATLCPVAWTGWQEVGVILTRFFESPEKMQRFADRWGGDSNQRLDFPIKAVDIGVAKRGSRVADTGQIRIRNVRFLE